MSEPIDPLLLRRDHVVNQPAANGSRDLSGMLIALDGRRRTYEVHLPPQYDGRTPLPAVLHFHGGGGNASIARRQTRLDATADREGFVVVYPEGTNEPGSLRSYTWNDGGCCGFAFKNNINDVQFTSLLLDRLRSFGTVDMKRVYACGFSNGARFCYRLARQLGGRFAAIGAVGSSEAPHYAGMSSPTRTPIIAIHGTADPNAPVTGGVGPNALTPVKHQAAIDVLQEWSYAALEAGDDPSSLYLATGEDWIRLGNRTGVPFELYLLNGGGHTWPGGEDVTPNAGTGKHIETFSANDVLWGYFKLFTRPKD